MLLDFFTKRRVDSQDEAPVVRGEISEEDFKQWLTDTFHVAVRRYQSGDIRGTMRILDRYYAMRDIADEDPLLSLLESGTVAIITFLAQKQTDDLHFAKAFELLQMAVDVLDSKFDRYQKAGDRPPPDSINWGAIVGVLGDAKWKAPEEYRDAVLTMNQMVYRYYKAESTMRRNLILLPQSKQQEKSILFNFTWNALGMIRAAIVHDPDRVAEIQHRVEEFHGPEYYSETKPYIFGIAITEECTSNAPNTERINRLYQKFNQLAIAQRPDNPHDALISASETERQHFTQTNSRRFVLLDG